MDTDGLPDSTKASIPFTLTTGGQRQFMAPDTTSPASWFLIVTNDQVGKEGPYDNGTALFDRPQSTVPAYPVQVLDRCQVGGGGGGGGDGVFEKNAP